MNILELMHILEEAYDRFGDIPVYYGDGDYEIKAAKASIDSDRILIE